MQFHPAVAAWFARRFAHGPTEAQARGWPAIAAGCDTLIAAPTGSGKTLAAFLVCIDRLYREHAQSGAEPEAGGTQVVYVSPLKALGVDIQQNLQTPLREIAQIAAELGLPAPEIRVAVRSGDTDARARAAMHKRPPHILITTPESLYLLLTAARTRRMLERAHTVIVDEIHAIAGDKRGAHLALSLQRLQHVARGPLVRVGLSATQRPIELVAKLLCGVDASGVARPCTIVDTGHTRALDLSVELPGSALEAVASNEQLGEIMGAIAAQVRERRTTLVFVNTRKLAERAAHMLGERLGEARVAAHHGSLSKERRLRVEQRLRAGELQAVVATASLELGIDVGPVELVVQIGSPRSIATLLQRVGRSGHSRFGLPTGRLYPLTRDELVECVALMRAVRARDLDALALSDAPLDILAQQIVAECAAEDWSEDALFQLLRAAAPYAELTPEGFERALSLVSEGIETGRGTRADYVQRDRIHGRLHARRGARLAALTSGGAIPEMADYRVIADPDETLIGTINEDFAIESMAGDVILLGTHAWRIRRVESGVVRVVDAQGSTPTIPFWLGEAPARTAELSQHVSALREEVDARLAHEAEPSVARWLAEDAGIADVCASEVLAYLGASRSALGALPTQRELVVERFFDDTGGMQLVLHAPFGGRINRALGLLIRKRFCTSFDFELQAAANDDAVVLSLGPQHSFPLEQTPGFLRSRGAHEALVHAVIVTPIFAVRWRWNLNRALVVLRWKRGKKNPPQIQRMEADDVMVAVFPSLAACQDNAVGPRVISDHVLVQQTLADCMREALDLAGLSDLLTRIERGQVRLTFRDTTEPSPLAHEIIHGKPYTFLDDAPLEERRTRAVQLRRGLPEDGRALAALDSDAIDRVRAEAEPAPRDPPELLDLLIERVALPPRAEWRALFDALVASERALHVHVSHAGRERELWCARERQREVLAAWPGASLAPELPLPALLSSAPAPLRDDVVLEMVRSALELTGPVTAPALAERLVLDEASVRAALAQLELAGFALRGAFDARLAEATEPQYCARRLLGRIHAYTRKRMRREIEPVTAQDFMRFLLRWQHVEPDQRLRGQAGVLRVIEQLQGLELPAAAWERDVLAARVEGYAPELLDALCLSGAVSWGRLGARTTALDTEGVASAPRLASLSRATPIGLALRGDFGWLRRACARAPLLTAPARADAAPDASALDPATACVLDVLRERGALFFSELLAASALPQDVLREALWDAVARGLVAADGFGALRNLLAPARLRLASAAASSPRTRLRDAARTLQLGEGRWALSPSTAPQLADEPDDDALAEAIAEQLLARWGVVLMDLYAHEPFTLPWRQLRRALRRLEDRGLARGGRFVSGFVGEQYALPEAVELLRALRDAPARATQLHLSACDPLNLTGVILPGPRVRSVARNTVAL